MNPIKTQNTQRSEILGYPVDILNNDDALILVQDALTNKKQMHIVTINPEMIIKAQKDEILRSSILNAELIIPDGSGILLALWMQGIFLKTTVPGIELSEKSLQYCAQNNIAVAMFGAKQEILDMAIKGLSQKYPGLNIACSFNGYFKEDQIDDISEQIAKSKPGLVLVAFGSPKQEQWINKYKDLFPQSVLIGVGGSFDVWSGQVKRAPSVFRKLKLEWFYRLITDPSRANRILTALPYFVIQLIINKFRPKLSTKHSSSF